MASRKLLGISFGLIVATASWLLYTHHTAFDGTTRIEAEDGNIVHPMKVVQHNDASGGSYITTPTGHKGTAHYTFHVPEDGIYKISARAYGASGEHNSFFFRIDDGKEKLWDVGRNRWRSWRTANINERVGGTPYNPRNRDFNIELASGLHTITFRGRENNTRLDYFTFKQIKPLPAAPFFSGINIDQVLNQAIMASLILLVFSTIYYLFKSAGTYPSKAAPETRIAALEKRFTDIQDVVISLDEKLNRIKKQTSEEFELKV